MEWWGKRRASVALNRDGLFDSQHGQPWVLFSHFPRAAAAFPACFAFLLLLEWSFALGSFRMLEFCPRVNLANASEKEDLKLAL